MTLCCGWRDKHGIVLAADRKVMTDDHGFLEDGKIFKIKNLTVAFAGDVIVEHVLRHSFRGNTEMPDVPTDSVCAFWYDTVRPLIERACPDANYQVIVSDGRELFVSMDGLLRLEQRKFVAIGEGAWYAYGYADRDMCFGTCTSGELSRHMFSAAACRISSVSYAYDLVVVGVGSSGRAKKRVKRRPEVWSTGE